jgi:phage tail-like protein
MVLINNRSTLATDPIRNFRFLATFTPHEDTPGVDANTVKMSPITYGFVSVSGLAVTTDSIPYREGGYNTTFHQIPGQTSFSPLTFQRGVQVGQKDGWNWMRNLFQTVNGADSNKAGNFRCDIEIEVLSHPIPGQGGGNAGSAGNDHVALRFKVYNAWITAIAYSDLNAGDNALMVEQMSVVHEGFDLKFADNLTDSAGNF